MILTLTHDGTLPPKITMTLFNDTYERDDYEIRNGDFVGFLWAIAYTFCVALLVTHLFYAEMGLIFGNDIESQQPDLVKGIRVIQLYKTF